MPLDANGSTAWQVVSWGGYLAGPAVLCRGPSSWDAPSVQVRPWTAKALCPVKYLLITLFFPPVVNC